MINTSENSLSNKKLEKLINGSVSLKIFECLESTNKTAKEMAKNGAAEGELIIAERQTGGRGRLGKSFFSPEGGVYFSLILRPKFSGEDIVLITTAAAVAVCRAIEKLSSKKAKIKWVNDVFVDGKKACGILTESLIKHNGGVDYVILGIGANISPPKDGFPDDIMNIAGTVFEEKKSFIREHFIAETVNVFMQLYKDIFSLKIRQEYKSYSVVLGKSVSFEYNGTEKTAEVVDIDERCRLVVKSGNEILTLCSGEVSLGSENFINN